MAPCLFPVSQALGKQHGEEASTKYVDYAQLDAFTAQPFKGNPAVVCLLRTAKPKEWMQNVATEFNAPMAAFLVHRSTPETTTSASSTEYNIRFFTPTAEVPLCGHASLASAYLLFTSNLARGSAILFHTQDSAILKATKSTTSTTSTTTDDNINTWQGQVELRFPIITTTPVTLNANELLPRTLQGREAVAAHTTSDGDRLIVELASAREVESLVPCLQEIAAGPGAVVVTAQGTAQSPFDFVSRFFAPRYGIPEDPVCGTAHCALAPLWAARLGKDTLLAYQASNRGGVLDLVVDRASNCVLLRGTAVVVAAGLLLA